MVAAWLVRRSTGPLIRVAVREQMTGEPEVEVQKRIDTLSDVVYRTALVVISAIAIVTILPEFGVNVAPLIAGLGLIGLAVGFGAQNVVRDVINGLEILVENQYARGDFVRLRTTTGGTVSGTVSDINLRRTTLNDQEGAVHFVPHGSIEVASNLTRGSSRVSFSLNVSNNLDIEKVFALIDQVGAELSKDETFGPLIREAPRAEGIERLAETSLDVRVDGVTQPGAQWRVAGELRRRLKQAFDADGIRLRE
jgi:small conductance mechanosensitive channel